MTGKEGFGSSQSQESTFSENIILPTTLQELALGSMKLLPIGDDIQLFPGLRLLEQLRTKNRRPDLLQLLDDENNKIEGRYGIRYIDPISKRATARAGFDVFNSKGGYLFLSHPPQGLPEDISTQPEGARLRQIGFRRVIMRKLIEIALSLDLDRIEAQRSTFTEKVIQGIISPEDGRKYYDVPCRGEFFGKRFKYKQGEDGRWVYKLK